MKPAAPQPIVRSRKPSVLTRDESPGSLAAKSLRQCGEVTVVTQDLGKMKPLKTHTHTHTRTAHFHH